MGIIIERQLPERGDRAASEAPAGHCCCCCCCCLHTVGSVAGALSARAVPVEPDTIPPAAADGPTLARRNSASGLYWLLVALASCLCGAYFYVVEAGRERTVISGVAIAMAFPFLQLAASLVAAIAIAVSRRPGKELRLRHLGKITWRGFLGGAIGVLIMLPMFARC